MNESYSSEYPRFELQSTPSSSTWNLTGHLYSQGSSVAIPGEGEHWAPPPRPPKMLLCEQGADRSSGPAGLSSPGEAFLNSVVSSCSSSSLRMKIPRVSLYSWVGKRGSVVDWWGNFHIGSCRDFSPRHQRGTHRVRRLEDMSEENTFSVKSPSMCQRLTFGTYPTFLEFTTVCLEKWCLFEDKE